ncbi:MAG TPA: sugar phosphate isomerase/epimerase [Planctomycetota bacterium]|nr:sugar phosphate isomerase/epimerase [Planctomycetota bacterium]
MPDMMELAYHTASWGANNFITALSDITAVGFRGIEAGIGLVARFEDRLGVFEEIMKHQELELVAITGGGRNMLNDQLALEVERTINAARFMQQTNTHILNYFAPPVPPPEAFSQVPVLPGPGATLGAEFNPAPQIKDLAGYQAAVAEGVNEIGQRCLDLGIKFCLHPELGTLCDTKADIDLFLKNTDPKNVNLCLDLGHLTKRGLHGGAFIGEIAKRIGYVHIKDLKLRSPDKKTKGRKKADPTSQPKGARAYAAIQKNPELAYPVALGEGVLDLEKFIAKLTEVTYSGWITIDVETATDASSRETAQASFKYADEKLDLVL